MSDDCEKTLHTFGSDTTLHAPRLPDRDEDRRLMKDMGRKVYAIMADADPLPSKERRNYILARLDEIDGGMREAAE